MRQLKITKRITARESMALDKYLNDISKIEMVSPEKERELARKIKEGDEDALDRLVEANLRFVVSVAKQYQNQGLSLSDLINEGNVGLMRAAKRFDETKGFRFISYAVWWIRQSILQAILEYSRLVRLPLNKINLYSRIKSIRADFVQEFEREPSVSEIAEAAGVSVKDVEKILEDGEKHLSLDAPMGGAEEGDAATLLDFYTQEDTESPDLALMDESLQNEIKQGLNALSPREVKVLQLYYGLGGEKALTQEEVGQRLGITRERVRQIRERGLRRLRHHVNPATLRSYLT